MLSNPNPTHPDEIETNATREAFLAEMSKHWNVYRAAKKIGISRKLVYNEWLHDTEFKARYDEILDSWIDGAESNLMSQAAQNEKAFVPAIFMLKSHRPETYDRQALSGRMIGPVTINIGQVANDTLRGLDLTGKASVRVEADEATGGDVERLEASPVEGTESKGIV